MLGAAPVVGAREGLAERDGLAGDEGGARPLKALLTRPGGTSAVWEGPDLHGRSMPYFRILL